MTGEQFAECAIAMEQLWPTLQITKSGLAMEIWFELVAEIDQRAFLALLKKHSAENKWAPTPNEIRAAYAELAGLTPKDPDAAWGEVTKAIRNYGSYRELDAFESMSNEVRDIVKSMGWKELCFSQNQMADRAHFMKMFAAKSERKMKQALLPQALTEQLSMIGNSMPNIKALADPLELKTGYEEVGYDED